MSGFVPPRKPQGPAAFRNINYSEPEVEAKPKGEGKPMGRPPTMEGGGKLMGVVLDSISLETALKLGNGNRSLGVREALRIAREAMQKTQE